MICPSRRSAYVFDSMGLQVAPVPWSKRLRHGADRRAASQQQRELNCAASPCHHAAQDQRRPFIAVARQKGVPVSLVTVAVLPAWPSTHIAQAAYCSVGAGTGVASCKTRTQCLLLPQPATNHP